MSNPKRRKKSAIKIILAIVGGMMLVAMIGVIVSGIWYKRQCNIIYDEVNSSVVSSGMKIYAEYEGEGVEISKANINNIINSVTDRMVLFTSADKMPDEEPVILRFANELSMEIYPANGYEVFVKHITESKTRYYYIENTCNFTNLKKMVSLDQWSYPNILVDYMESLN